MNLQFKKSFLFLVIFLITITTNFFYMKELGDDVANVFGDFFSIIIVPPLVGAFVGLMGYIISKKLKYGLSRIKEGVQNSVSA